MNLNFNFRRSFRRYSANRSAQRTQLGLTGLFLLVSLALVFTLGAGTSPATLLDRLDVPDDWRAASTASASHGGCHGDLDASGECQQNDSATFTIALNALPTADPFTAVVNFDEDETMDFPANDPDGTVDLTAVSPDTGWSGENDGNLQATYNPPDGAAGDIRAFDYTVEDNQGGTAGDTVRIGIDGPPTANFYKSDQTVTADGHEITVDASGSSDDEFDDEVINNVGEDVVSYEWDRGGNGSPDGSGETYAFEVTNSSPVIIGLTVTDDEGDTAYIEKSVSINGNVGNGDDLSLSLEPQEVWTVARAGIPAPRVAVCFEGDNVSEAELRVDGGIPDAFPNGTEILLEQGSSEAKVPDSLTVDVSLCAQMTITPPSEGFDAGTYRIPVTVTAAGGALTDTAEVILHVQRFQER